MRKFSCGRYHRLVGFAVFNCAFAMSVNGWAQTAGAPNDPNQVLASPNRKGQLGGKSGSNCYLEGGTVQVPCPQAQTLGTLIDRYQNILAQYDPDKAAAAGDEEALRRLPDVTLETTLARTEQLQALHEDIKAFDSSRLSEPEQISYQLLDFLLTQYERLAPFDEDRIPFTNDSGFYNVMVFKSKQSRFETVTDYEAYASRLSALPRFFGQNKKNMRRGIAANYTAYTETMPIIISAVKDLTGPIEDHPLYQPFANISDAIDELDKQRLKQLGQAAMKNAVIPAYTDLLEFLQNDYAPYARKAPGIGTTPQGRAHYASLVRYYTTQNLSPDEVHELGLKEVARIRSEMDAIIADLGFEGSFAEFLDFLRTDPQFYAQTPKDLLKEAAWLAKQIDGKMPEFFRTLPRLSYGVSPVPDTMAPNYTAGRYWGGNPATGKAGHYMVNTYNLSQRPLYNLPALTLHEGVPGHHHQISLGQEQAGIPDFRRNTYINAFGEGWGLYSEKLGIEMGIYQTPYEDFGRLTYEMWRACRLVVDTGIHWKGWSKEKATTCFLENSALSHHNIETEVARYISWPGQALSYKIGEMKILELRQRAEKALGSSFSIRDFHDAVLMTGSIPLDLLEARIDLWINDQTTGLPPKEKTQAP